MKSHHLTNDPPNLLLIFIADVIICHDEDFYEYKPGLFGILVEQFMLSFNRCDLLAV